jgi:hypothetical protein
LAIWQPYFVVLVGKVKLDFISCRDAFQRWCWTERGSSKRGPDLVTHVSF